MRLRLGLSTKINLIIVTAMMIPLLVLAFLSVRTIREIGISNLEAFVSENGSRRQAAIGDDLRDSLRILNEFIVANDDALSLTLTQQATSIQDEAQIASLNQDLQGLIRRDLIDTGYYNSVRVLSEVYFPLASITMSQSPLSAETLQEQREAVSQIANQLNINNGNVQVFGISNRDDTTRVEVLTALLDEATDGTSNIAGYLLVDLNLTEIFIDNLTLEEIFFDTSAYVIVEGGSERIVIAPDDVLDNRLFDVNSFGAERALSNLGNTVNIYDVEAEDGITREVVGYSSNLTIDNNTFVVITEVDTSQLLQLITERTVGQIFVFVVVLTVLILLACLLVANQLILPPVQSLRDAILAVIRGDFSAPVMGTNRSDEIGSLATSFVDMRAYIRELTDDMTRRLDERTRDVQVTQDIAQAMTTERELTALMTRVVTLIADNFPSIYHAQIFLIDDAREYAVLRASTGAAGRELLGRGHKLRVGSISLVGQVAEQAKVVIARDTAESSVHRENQFLGDTRAEVGIPLQLSNQIIGVLDVQSKQRDSFTSE
ncbi:MAG: GAF domain-containing protein, partial [Chloroflexota bacterium]